ncbi:hypothetical protein Y1Q_0003716 [Alligator mississippiensis]|uniref:Uncharacterized protein n=1 Tax=Alligator mississippiensis TaxID=8496 RepID=A0A151MN11_ALLMI|nr:hypothetical protein Y1Q_0003716 [Alligator mississippiensis]
MLKRTLCQYKNVVKNHIHNQHCYTRNFVTPETRTWFQKESKPESIQRGTKDKKLSETKCKYKYSVQRRQL